MPKMSGIMYFSNPREFASKTGQPFRSCEVTEITATGKSEFQFTSSDYDFAELPLGVPCMVEVQGDLNGDLRHGADGKTFHSVKYAITPGTLRVSPLTISAPAPTK